MFPTEENTQETFESGPNMVAKGNWVLVTIEDPWSTDQILFTIKMSLKSAA